MLAQAAPEVKILAIPPVDLSRVEDGVREQIRRVQAELAGAPEAAAERASESYASLGRLYAAYEFQEAAEVCFGNAQALAPEDYRWPYYLGRIREQQGRLEEALSEYRRAAALRPQYGAALLRAGGLLLRLGQTRTAERAFQGALELDPKSGAAQAGLGRSALALADPKRAIERLQAALALAPEASSLHYELAMAYRQTGAVEQARAHLARRGAVEPGFADPLAEELEELKTGKRIRWLRAAGFYQSGKFREAAAEFQKILAGDPADAVAHTDYGSTLMHLGDAAGALEQNREALRLAPGSTRVRYNLATALAHTGSEAEAVEHYRAAVKLDPGSKDAQFHLANLLMRLGRDDEALAHYAAAIELDPANWFAAFMQAMARVRLGRYAEARENLERGMSVFPERLEIKHALARLMATAPEPSLRDGARAIKLMQQIFAAQSDPDLEHVETLAMSLAEIGQHRRAAELERQIMARVEALGRRDVLPMLGGKLAAYESGRAWREPWPKNDPVFSPVLNLTALLPPSVETTMRK